jgi:hypothetical protein
VGVTRVTMADGSLKKIKRVEVGDMVMTRFGPRKVLNAGRSINYMERVRVDFGTGQSLCGTLDHPILTHSAWVALGDLKVGDVVYAMDLDGRMLTTEVTGSEVLKSYPQVYDLTVEGAHEFVANGIIVHNCDEVAAWTEDEGTWDMAMFGLRLGEHPRVVWTSTPKPKTFIRQITAPKVGRIITRGSTYENRENLAKSFYEQLKKYEGTQLGRQELMGEMIDAEEGGIINRYVG